MMIDVLNTFSARPSPKLAAARSETADVKVLPRYLVRPIADIVP